MKGFEPSISEEVRRTPLRLVASKRHDMGHLLQELHLDRQDKSMATRLYSTSGRSWATRCGDQISRLLISAIRPPRARPARVAPTIPGDVSEFRTKWYGPVTEGTPSVKPIRCIHSTTHRRNGKEVLASSKRGHGRSTPTWLVTRLNGYHFVCSSNPLEQVRCCHTARLHLTAGI